MIDYVCDMIIIGVLLLVYMGLPLYLCDIIEKKEEDND